MGMRLSTLLKALVSALVGASFLYRPNPSPQLPGGCLSGGDPGPQSVLSKTEAKDTEALPSLCQCGRGWEEQVGEEEEEVEGGKKKEKE